MKDLAAAFGIFFITLGPVKIVPPFFLMTHNNDRRTVWLLALKSTIVSTCIVLFIDFVVSATMVKWRVSADAMAIAGGILLLGTSIKTISNFNLIESPAAAIRQDEAVANGGTRPSASAASEVTIPWLGQPVLSPIAIPTIITPVGVVAILFYADTAVGDEAYAVQLIGLLLAVMALNFVAMILAGPIMRFVGVPILQTFGWVLSALQAGLAVQVIIGALRRLQVIP
jgi:multiple antibiotic resistance protein